MVYSVKHFFARRIYNAGEAQELEIAFNPEYLRTGIESAPTDEVIIEIARPASPVLIRGAGSDEFLYLLMPIRN